MISSRTGGAKNRSIMHRIDRVWCGRIKSREVDRMVAVVMIMSDADSAGRLASETFRFAFGEGDVT